MRSKDLKAGMVFGRLTLMSVMKDENNRIICECKCDCGNTIKIVSTDLTCKGKKTCGCYLGMGFLNTITSHGGSKTKLYKIWSAARQRCGNPNDVMYSYYGGRGITVCGEWEDFSAFRDWANQNGYIEGKLDLDRIDNNSGYRPDNCRFISHRENLCNTRRRLVTESEGKEETLSEIAIRVGLPYNVIWGRYKRGERGEQLERKRDKTFKKSR